ncbi:PadR family transcriptional regulator [uncultured Cellulomonas sp.]|uniref:PadR family transcriptional regulator n=1 Tax=uncultured Cellulomonas sp. TaxID=189682 RepID=UPI0028E1BF1B|nr:PadR family transcriptional regulator [uncultured Cellulomonas sp.]
MSVRQGMLALLADEPMHAYQLRQQFEQRTGGTWPLNMGQVSTTLDRLVRDGLVESPTDDDVPQYTLTDAGRTELADWWSTAVVRSSPTRDELTIKLALAVTVPGVDVVRLVQTQRTETLRALRDLTRLKADVGQGFDELAWSLVLDNLVFAAEAEVRWLDHVEARVTAASRTAAAPTPVPARDEVSR